MRGGSKKRKKMKLIPPLMSQLVTGTATNINEETEEKGKKNVLLMEKVNKFGCVTTRRSHGGFQKDVCNKLSKFEVIHN